MQRIYDQHPWLTTLVLALIGGGSMAVLHSNIHAWPALWALPIPVTLMALGAGRRQAFLGAIVLVALGAVAMLSVAWDTRIALVMVAYRLMVLWVALLLAPLVRRATSLTMAVLVYPCVLVTAELAMSFGPLGTAQTDAYVMSHHLPLMQMVAWTGIFGVSFVVAAGGAMVALWLWQPRERLGRVALLITALFLFGLVGGGWGRMHRADLSQTVTMAAIHAESFSGKPRSVAQNLQRTAAYGKLAEEAAEQGAQVVVWPEMILSTEAAWDDSVTGAVASIAARTGAVQVVGFYHRDRKRNTAQVVGADGTLEAEYQKTHLVAAMETSLPGTEPAPVLALSGMEMALGVMICNDDVFTDVSRQLGHDGATVVVDPTWDWPAVATEHEIIARVRAIENGFTLIRATQGGISQFIDPLGKTIASHSVFENPRQVLVGDIPVGGLSTAYSRHGDVFAWLIVGGLTVLVAFSVLKRS